MVGKCANPWCSASRNDDGTLFSAEIELGNAAGELQTKTVCLWLCARCAREMSPKIDVTGDVVSIKLAALVKPRMSRAHPARAVVN